MYRIIAKGDFYNFVNSEIIDEEDIGDFNQRKMISHGNHRNISRNIRLLYDGLKPVHRRLLYDMAITGNTSNKPHIKCSRIVGDTMAKMHPHSDSSLYEALIFMGQAWRTMLPLIDIKGNGGNAKDSSSYADMRYVECRLTKFAEDCFFSDWNLKSNLAEMKATFNNDGKEPISLPTKYPYFLMNWGSGIGFAIATDAPGFLPQDAMQAVIDLINDPQAKIVLYPEDPLGSTIIGKKVFRKFVDYDFDKKKENLTYRVRSNYYVDEDGNIIITSIPYEVNSTTVIKRIRESVNDKKLDGISDIKAYPRKGKIPQLNSLGSTMEIHIDVKAGFDPQTIMEKLYKITDLESTFSLNNVYVHRKRNVKLNLRDSILLWIDVRRKLLKKKFRIEISDRSKRSYVLDALIQILDSKEKIDETIRIIRSAGRGQAAVQLAEKFDLSEYQADKISHMTLSDLAPYKYNDFVTERETNNARLNEVKVKLETAGFIDKVIIEEMNEGIKKYSRIRQSEVIEASTGIDLDAKYTIEVTSDGFIRKVEDGEKIGFNQIDGSRLIARMNGVSNLSKVVVFNERGESYSEMVHRIKPTRKNASGTKLKYKKDALIVGAIVVNEDSKDELMFITKNGIVKKTSIGSYFVSAQGSVAIKLTKNDCLVEINTSHSDKDQFIIYTRDGRSSIVSSKEITSTARATQGVIGIKLENDDQVIGMTTRHEDDMYGIVVTASGTVKKFELDATYANVKRGITAGIRIVPEAENLHKMTCMNEKDKHLGFISFEDEEVINISDLKVKTRLSSGDKVLKGRRKQEIIIKF